MGEQKKLTAAERLEKVQKKLDRMIVGLLARRRSKIRRRGAPRGQVKTWMIVEPENRTEIQWNKTGHMSYARAGWKKRRGPKHGKGRGNPDKLSRMERLGYVKNEKTGKWRKVGAA